MNKVSGQPSGYTILETMIFLLVSGILFFSAMLLVNGSQRKAEFETLVRDFDTKLQSVIGNVTSGYYNNPGAVSCSAQLVAGVWTPVIDPMTSSTQGQNSDCISVGQFISMPIVGDDFATITSHAGLRLKNGNSGPEVTNLTESNHVPISQTVETVTFINGVTAKMRIATKDSSGNIVSGVPIDTMAITPTFANFDSNNFLESGSSRVEVYGNVAGVLTALKAQDGIQICFLDDSGQTGLIYLNAGNTRVTIDNTTGNCPW